MSINTPLIRYNSAQFLTSAAQLDQCPPDIGAEVAFAGRSNAGKSSAINSLTGNKKLARTSKTPGRTQLLNFFSLNIEQTRLVDLPGYGYAKVPMAMKEHWKRHLDKYLQNRRSLKGVVLLIDIRHPMKEFDQAMVKWCSSKGMPLHILLTKADKLKRGAAQNTMLQLRKTLNEQMGNLGTVQTFSALKNEGTDQLSTKLNEWLAIEDEYSLEEEDEFNPDPSEH